MNNEPVAWIEFGIAGAPVALNHTWAIEAQKSGNKVSLYTHPVKELTDEEILIICFDTGITGWKLSDGNMDAEIMLDFARAILRKAQEK